MSFRDQSIAFQERMRSGETLLGSFIKTPTIHGVEILAGACFEFVVIDEEHAPIDRGATDQIILACHACGIAGFVRVAEPTAPQILSALDCGATGVLVPHVYSAKKAASIARAGHYRGGNRGFSNSPRAGRYGMASMADHIAKSDASTVIVAMIEDPEALNEIEPILATAGIGAAFIGRGDLTVALGASKSSDPIVRNAVDTIIAAAKKTGVPIWMMVASAAEAKDFQAAGVNTFIVSSDQGFMRQAAQKTRSEFDGMKAR